ncbi:glucose-fructose oxidoreductase [Prosthecobacter fusiformis]|uniref:Glucose-fructose oxidoreductase n=1 Tax=Prosthecobacter fusiformis TaxID=48464 RepID=A0A4R7S3N7_9BACT|nr:Gfo/Idh/MocA family oxidoreductase [Prosthecobacter fusiformis]TDU72941.1 glucose-fructose oxidoreductase [Prosthecobacter fusiformis]
MKRWRIAGINFEHFHMGDLLRQVFEHPLADIVGICDEQPQRMVEAARQFGLHDGQVFTDFRSCLEFTRPDIVIMCPAASKHGEWVHKVAPFGTHIMIEKPFAASLAEADAMVTAMKPHGKVLAVNWPLVWDAGQQTAHRLVQEGLIGQIVEFHHHGGNRGPLFHGADKADHIPTAAEKAESWFYSQAQGGGSLLDYMGYGTTLGSWHMSGQVPLEVTCTWDHPSGLEVDEHSVTVIRYATGLSKTETRWGTFTDPWTHQPQPKCGFVLRGTDGTLSCYDYEKTLWVQTRTRPEGYAVPVDVIASPNRNPVEHLIHSLETGTPLIGPLTLQISRLGQQIVDTAFQSAQQKRTLSLLG